MLSLTRHPSPSMAALLGVELVSSSVHGSKSKKHKIVKRCHHHHHFVLLSPSSLILIVASSASHHYQYHCLYTPAVHWCCSLSLSGCCLLVWLAGCLLGIIVITFFVLCCWCSGCNCICSHHSHWHLVVVSLLFMFFWLPPYITIIRVAATRDFWFWQWLAAIL